MAPKEKSPSVPPASDGKPACNMTVGEKRATNSRASAEPKKKRTPITGPEPVHLLIFKNIANDSCFWGVLIGLLFDSLQ